MNFTCFSHNGELRPIGDAVVRLDNIAYSYGYGVYETIRVSNGIVLFTDLHIQRLLHSAEIIELSHSFSDKFVLEAIEKLVNKNDSGTYNLKILLIGGSNPELFIQCLLPHFPDRKLYKNGVACITEHVEREYTQAKTLNMMPSYIANMHAKDADAFEALLLNSNDEITEGTRSNFFAVKDSEIFTPPASVCLEGVTRLHVIQLAEKCGFSVVEAPLTLSKIKEYSSVFVTSTSFKIMPIRKINAHVWDSPVSSELKTLMKAYEEFLSGQIN